MLIAMAGLPGTGKSSLARQLARDLSGVILNKDEIRAALFPPSWIEYSTKQDDFCMSILFQVASYLLSENPNRYVILDGRTFSYRYQVLELDQAAEKLNIPLKIIECVCSDETARRRLERDVPEGRHPADNRDYALYLSIKARFEPIREPKLVVNTDNDFADCVKLCISYIVGEIE
jgi:predicted kinase